MATITTTLAQIPKEVDTLDYYVFFKMQNEKNSCIIDGESYPKKHCDKIVSTLSNYDHLDYNDFKLEDIRFTRYRDVNETLLHTQYEIDPDLAPFGQYINYYPSGGVKSKWYFQEPDSTCSNNGVMEGTWLYFDVNGDTVGTKRFQDGLAHGKWTSIVDDSTWVVKEFENGLSEGFWSVHRIVHGSELSRPYAFHKGFYHSIYSCEESFETPLDNDENVYEKERILEVDSIEYAENRRYIKNGKFFILRDGIKIGMKEFKDGDLIQHVKFDYR